MPELTRPNMVCFPSSHCVGASVKKNWEPLESGPLFAIDKIPAPGKIQYILVRKNRETLKFKILCALV